MRFNDVGRGQGCHDPVKLKPVPSEGLQEISRANHSSLACSAVPLFRCYIIGGARSASLRKVNPIAKDRRFQTAAPLAAVGSFQNGVKIHPESSASVLTPLKWSRSATHAQKRGKITRGVLRAHFYGVKILAERYARSKTPLKWSRSPTDAQKRWKNSHGGLRTHFDGVKTGVEQLLAVLSTKTQATCETNSVAAVSDRRSASDHHSALRERRYNHGTI